MAIQYSPGCECFCEDPGGGCLKAQLHADFGCWADEGWTGGVTPQDCHWTPWETTTQPGGNDLSAWVLDSTKLDAANPAVEILWGYLTYSAGTIVGWATTVEPSPSVLDSWNLTTPPTPTRYYGEISSFGGTWETTIQPIGNVLDNWDVTAPPEITRLWGFLTYLIGSVEVELYDDPARTNIVGYMGQTPAGPWPQTLTIPDAGSTGVSATVDWSDHAEGVHLAFEVEISDDPTDMQMILYSDSARTNEVANSGQMAIVGDPMTVTLGGSVSGSCEWTPTTNQHTDTEFEIEAQTSNSEVVIQLFDNVGRTNMIASSGQVFVTDEPQTIPVNGIGAEWIGEISGRVTWDEHEEGDDVEFVIERDGRPPTDILPAGTTVEIDVDVECGWCLSVNVKDLELVAGEPSDGFQIDDGRNVLTVNRGSGGEREGTNNIIPDPCVPYDPGETFIANLCVDRDDDYTHRSIVPSTPAACKASDDAGPETTAQIKIIAGDRDVKIGEVLLYKPNCEDENCPEVRCPPPPPCNPGIDFRSATHLLTDARIVAEGFEDLEAWDDYEGWSEYLGGAPATSGKLLTYSEGVKTNHGLLNGTHPWTLTIDNGDRAYFDELIDKLIGGECLTAQEQSDLLSASFECPKNWYKDLLIVWERQILTYHGCRGTCLGPEIPCTLPPDQDGGWFLDPDDQGGLHPWLETAGCSPGGDDRNYGCYGAGDPCIGFAFVCTQWVDGKLPIAVCDHNTPNPVTLPALQCSDIENAEQYPYALSHPRGGPGACDNDFDFRRPLFTSCQETRKCEDPDWLDHVYEIGGTATTLTRHIGTTRNARIKWEFDVRPL